MKKAIFVAMAFVLVASGVYATQNLTTAAPKAENVYTYYLEDDCDNPISCSPEYTGPICSEYFEGSIVYDAPGCLPVHQTTSIIGRKQP